MNVRTAPASLVPVVLWALRALPAAAAERAGADVPEPPPVDAPAGLGPLVIQILDFFPFAAAAVCVLVLVGVHFAMARRHARRWQGAPVGWLGYWGWPCAAAATLYLALCAGMMVWGFGDRAFEDYVGANFDLRYLVNWAFVGLLLALAPALLMAVRPNRAVR